MRATAPLVRWQGGWYYLDSEEDLVIEFCQGQSGDGPEMLRKAQVEQATYGQGQREVTVGVRVATGDPVPGVDWTVGDQVTADGSAQDVVALTMALEDATGQWSDVPQFGVVLDEPEQRIARNFRSVGGVNGGTSHLARPVQSIPSPGVRP